MRLALAGDTMLGRQVADAIERSRRPPLDPDVVTVAAEADLFVLNLECCVSARGERWPDPDKPFFFRAPPFAAELLAEIGVDCVTLANNHALDYGPDALLDTLDHLRARAWPPSAPAPTRRPRAARACSPPAAPAWPCSAYRTTRPTTPPGRAGAGSRTPTTPRPLGSRRRSRRRGLVPTRCSSPRTGDRT